MNINKFYSLQLVFANEENGYYGDIYASWEDAATAHPGEKIIFGVNIIESVSGYTFEDSEDWYDVSNIPALIKADPSDPDMYIPEVHDEDCISEKYIERLYDNLLVQNDIQNLLTDDLAMDLCGWTIETLKKKASKRKGKAPFAAVLYQEMISDEESFDKKGRHFLNHMALLSKEERDAVISSLTTFDCEDDIYGEGYEKVRIFNNSPYWVETGIRENNSDEVFLDYEEFKEKHPNATDIVPAFIINDETMGRVMWGKPYYNTPEEVVEAIKNA